MSGPHRVRIRTFFAPNSEFIVVAHRSRYCYDIKIPPSIMAEDDVRALWDTTNIIICTCV